MKLAHDKVKMSMIAASLFVVIAAIAAISIFFDEFKGFIQSESTPSINIASGTETGIEETQEIADVRDFGHPEVAIKDGQFVFLSGGFEPAETPNEELRDNIYVYPSLTSDPVYYTADWQLDAFALTGDGKSVVYSSFHTEGRLYRVYHYGVLSGENTLLAEFDISDSPIFTLDHVHLPLSAIALSPDEQYYYLISLRFDHENYVGLEPDSFVQLIDGGEVVVLNLPQQMYQTYWFSNSEIAFSGATFGGSGYDAPYVQIYNIFSHEIVSTLIPSRGASSGLNPRVNPAATAYVYYDVVANHGYACGGQISNLVIRSYPENDILFSLDNLHEVTYRWLNDTELEITYTPTPLPLSEYPRRNKMGPEDIIQCLEEEVMIYQVPEQSINWP